MFQISKQGLVFGPQQISNVVDAKKYRMSPCPIAISFSSMFGSFPACCSTQRAHCVIENYYQSNVVFQRGFGCVRRANGVWLFVFFSAVKNTTIHRKF